MLPDQGIEVGNSIFSPILPHKERRFVEASAGCVSFVPVYCPFHKFYHKETSLPTDQVYSPQLKKINLAAGLKLELHYKMSG